MSLENEFLKDKNVESRVNNFFDQASIYVPNKFIVLLFGEYVINAISKLEEYARRNNQVTVNGNNVYLQNFDRWKDIYFSNNGQYLDLKWTCSSVNIPNVNSETEDGDFLLDSIKGIRYPLIKTHQKIQTLTLKIKEDRHLMMYNFFNSLTNQFHVAKALKPRSSFHKMSLLVIALTQNEDANTTSVENIVGDYLNKRIESIPGQVFEFNSAVLSNLEQINLTNETRNSLEYTVSFKVPNAFQSSFNTSIAGLRDNTSDASSLTDVIVDKSMLTGIERGIPRNADGSVDLDKIEYNTGNFEQDKKTLRRNLRIFDV